MNFSSITFLFYFLPLGVMLYFMLGSLPGLNADHKRAVKNCVLLFLSLLFYAWGEGIFLVLLLSSIVINHAFAIAIDKDSRKKT